MNTLHPLINDFSNSYNYLYQDEEYYYLYKHLAIDKDKLVFNIFNECQLKFTQPIYFNDPYDCLFLVEHNFSNFNKKSLEEKIGENISDLKWLKHKNQFRAKAIKLFEEKSLADEIRKGCSVTCFNSNPLNMLMWSHYAQHHQGFMIEFRFPKVGGCKQLTGLDIPLPVHYTEEYPIVTLPWDQNMCEQDQISFMHKALLYKSLDWEYEKEFRLLAPKAIDGDINSLLFNFNPLIISSIVLGAKMSSEDQELIKKAINNLNIRNLLNIEIYQASLVEGKYKINVKHHPFLSH